MPAVIDFDRKAISQCLVSAISVVIGEEVSAEEVNCKWNCSGVVDAIFNQRLNRSPEKEEWEQIRSKQLDCVKSYFVGSEDNFDVWPGIQNLLKTIEKKKNWDYLILSEFWEDDTQFILNSCGFYSRNMKILTAEGSYRSGPQLKKYLKKSEFRREDRVYLVTQNLKRKNVTKNRKRWNLIRQKPPVKKKSGLISYPRFSKFF